MIKILERLQASTSSLQNILVSIGLIIGAGWALYTFFIQENKANKFSPDVYIEHELLTDKHANKTYLQVFLVVKNSSIQDLSFKLQNAKAELKHGDNQLMLSAKPVNDEIVIHPGQIMKLPYLFQIDVPGIYLLSVELPLDKRHIEYLVNYENKTRDEATSYSFNAHEYVYAGD